VGGVFAFRVLSNRPSDQRRAVKKVFIPVAAAALVFLHPPATPQEAIVEYVGYLDIVAGVCELIDQYRKGGDE
jgi:hypothetical protein